MKHALQGGVVALCLLPALALAQDSLAFSTAVDLNYKRLELTTSVTTPTATFNNRFTPHLWTVAVSPSLAYKGIFLSAGLERTLGEGSTSGPSNDGTAWTDRRDSRDENNITLGYNVWQGWSAFVGYLNNRTEAKINTGGSLTFTESSENGAYYGLAYSHRFARGGTLGASFAVTRADGEFFSQTSTNLGVQITAEGDVEGTSYGLTWSAPLVGSLFYRVGYKGTRYDFEFVDTNGFRRTNKRNFDAVFLGVANYF